MTTDTKTKAPVRYYVNGKRRGDTLNKFGNIAYFNTKGIEGKDRITTKELKALLATLGVEDHASFPWEVTLPNGVVLAAKADDGQSPTGEVKSPDRTQAREAAAAAQDDTKTPGGTPAPAKPKADVKAPGTKTPPGPKVKGSRMGPSARKAAKTKKATATARKAPAKKATAAKKATTTKAATSSERAKAGVTPRPKPTRAN